jgi:anti-sigma B factor antagonist
VLAPEEIDIANDGKLRVAPLPAASAGGGTFVVDISRTRFCDSSGLHALVDAHKRVQDDGAQMLLALGGPAVLGMFEITGADRVLLHFRGAAGALTHLAAAGAPGPPGY